MAAGALQWSLPAAQISRVLGLARPQRAVAVTSPPPAASGAQRGTPEIYFVKTIDNSRLVRVHDPARTRELRLLGTVCLALLLLLFVYAWQHFGAVEYGYRLEAQKAQHDALLDENRELRLHEAALRDPERIDRIARRMGLEPPQVGQVARIDQSSAEPAAPMLAQATTAPLVVGR
jgi:cell division protein FtsL